MWLLGELISSFLVTVAVFTWDEFDRCGKCHGSFDLKRAAIMYYIGHTVFIISDTSGVINVNGFPPFISEQKHSSPILRHCESP